MQVKSVRPADPDGGCAELTVTDERSRVAVAPSYPGPGAAPPMRAGSRAPSRA